METLGASWKQLPELHHVVSYTPRLDFLPLSCVFCGVWIVSGVPQSSWGNYDTGWFDLCLEKTGFRSVCRQNEVSSCWSVSCLTHWPTGHHFLSWWKLCHAASRVTCQGNISVFGRAGYNSARKAFISLIKDVSQVTDGKCPWLLMLCLGQDRTVLGRWTAESWSQWIGEDTMRFLFLQKLCL